MRECFARMKDELNFCEIPLLFESGYQNLFDNVIVVLRDRAARITAIKERDGLQHQEICKIFFLQKFSVNIVTRNNVKSTLLNKFRNGRLTAADTSSYCNFKIISQR